MVMFVAPCDVCRSPADWYQQAPTGHNQAMPADAYTVHCSRCLTVLRETT